MNTLHLNWYMEPVYEIRYWYPTVLYLLCNSKNVISVLKICLNFSILTCYLLKTVYLPHKIKTLSTFHSLVSNCPYPKKFHFLVSLSLSLMYTLLSCRSEICHHLIKRELVLSSIKIILLVPWKAPNSVLKHN